MQITRFVKYEDDSPTLVSTFLGETLKLTVFGNLRVY